MAFFPVLSFVLLFLFGSANTWAACRAFNGNVYRGNCSGVITGVGVCPNYSESGPSCSSWNDGPYPCPSKLFSQTYNGYYTGFRGYCSSSYSLNCSYSFICDTETESDSTNCVLSGKIWSNGQCRDNYVDTTYVCQNVGENNVLTGGYPSKSLIFTCVGDVCENTATLSGTCQDWGYCPDGAESCEIPRDSTGRRPCTRSGVGTTSTTICYYQCVDGRQLRCRPTSTQYVAGSIYVGTCPERPPTSCDPPPNYSSSSVASSSGSNDPNSSGSGSGGTSSGSGSGGTSSGSGDSQNYWPILEAIHDTLHVANVQREVLEHYAAQISPLVESIEQSTFDVSRIDNQINNRLLSLQQNGIKIEKSSKRAIDSTVTILDEINRYLRHDSLVVYSHDTSYNPLLRDLKQSIETQTDSIASQRIPAVDTSLLNRALYQIINNFAPSDSSARRACAELNECLATSSAPVECYNSSNRSCYDGGTPFDGAWNVEFGVLKTLWNGIFGDDSTELSRRAPDTSYTPPPAADSAKRSILDVISAMFSADSTAAMLQKVNAMKDSVERSKNDSASIQPDSLWLDSANAAQYVQNALITAPTVEECFVCHADLGTLGGLAPDGLQIHIDFSNICGFNICAIIRAVVRIIGFVVCLSLTLGSWAAAFGYNPKNDA